MTKTVSLKIWLLLALGVASLPGLLGLLGVISGPFPLQSATVSFASVMMVAVWHTAVRDSAGISFLHLLSLLTAFGWVAYSFSVTGMPEEEVGPASFEAAILAMLQNIVAIIVAVFACGWLHHERKYSNRHSWFQDLVIAVQGTPMSLLLSILTLHLTLTSYTFSRGFVMSGTGLVMIEAGVLESIAIHFGMTVGPTITLLGFCLLLASEKRRRLLGLSIVVLQVLLAFLAGRRGLLGVVVFGGFTLIAVRGFRFKRILLLGSAISIVVGLGWPAFLMMRRVAQEHEIHLKAVDERFEVLKASAMAVASDFSLQTGYTEGYSANLSRRFQFSTGRWNWRRNCCRDGTHLAARFC